jgi:hypothetical protein
MGFPGCQTVGQVDSFFLATIFQPCVHHMDVSENRVWRMPQFLPFRGDVGDWQSQQSMNQILALFFR